VPDYEHLPTTLAGLHYLLFAILMAILMLKPFVELMAHPLRHRDPSAALGCTRWGSTSCVTVDGDVHLQFTCGNRNLGIAEDTGGAYACVLRSSTWKGVVELLDTFSAP
jgi:hypothetical protein